MLTIDLLLELLDDRKTWCTIDEIADKASLSRLEASGIIKFLTRYKFILLDKQGRKAKVTKDIHEFLTEIRQEEVRNSIQSVKRFSPRLSLKSL